MGFPTALHEADESYRRRGAVYCLGESALKASGLGSSEVEGLGFRVEGLGFRVEGLGLRAEGF